MKLSKKLQLGLLFCLYLARSGKTTIEYAASGLGVSETFLAQVAGALRKAKVLKSTKGPAGGYELNGEPLVGDVFKALAPVKIVVGVETGMPEYRALFGFTTALRSSLSPVLNRKIKNLVGELYANDNARLNRPSPSTRVN